MQSRAHELASDSAQQSKLNSSTGYRRAQITFGGQALGLVAWIPVLELLSQRTGMGHSSETKKASIPSWQRQEETQGKETIEETSDSSHGNSSDASSQDDLLEKASRFLDEDGIRDAPKERKVSFLEGKGLTREEIEILLKEAPEGEDGRSSDEEVSPQAEEVR